MKRKKRGKPLQPWRCVVAVVLLGIVMLSGVFLWRKVPPDIPATLGTVEGLPLSRVWFTQVMDSQRAAVIADFRSRLGTEYSETFWTTAVQGETPLTQLKDKALAVCVRAMVQEKLALERGISEKVTYDAIVADLDRENAQRKADHLAGKVVYGPLQYTPENYFTYVQDNLIIRLKSKMENEDFQLTEAQVEALYTQYKDTRYSLKTWQTLRIILPAADDAAADRAAKALESAAAQLREGRSPEQVAAGLPGGSVKAETWSPGTARDDIRLRPDLRTAVEGLGEGMVSAPVTTGREVSLLMCTAVTLTGYKPLEEVRSHIRSSWTDACYEEFIDHRAASADVRPDKAAIAALRP